jgi:hypothetical protein
MVHDDDTPRTGNIPRKGEPLVTRAPGDEYIRDLILDAARTHPKWDRIRIWEELRERNRDKHPDQAEVNYVLKQYNLRNLDL